MSSILVHVSSINFHPWRCHPSLGQSHPQGALLCVQLCSVLLRKCSDALYKKQMQIASKHALQMRRLTVEDFVAVNTDRGADTEREQ